MFIILFTSCGKDDEQYTVLYDDIIGKWELSGVDSYTVKTSDGIFDDAIINNILNYSSKTDYISFSKAGDLYWLERKCERRGILGCSFTIDGDRLMYVSHVEAFDLRLLNDTLFMSIDQTMEFNRDLKTTNVRKATIRNKFVKLK